MNFKGKHICSRRRAAAMILALALTLLLIPSAGAWAYSTSCPNTYTNTGNQAVDIAQVALTQEGYTETSSNHTKYAAWYYGNDTSVAWCGIFISWCANQAGIPTSVIRKNAMASGYSTSNMSSNSFGTPAYAFGSTTAKVGDIIYVDSNGSGTSNHVGLVYAVDSTYIYTVEGNSSGKVAKVKYLASSGHRQLSSYTSSAHILFYARPNYSNSAGSGSSNSGSAGTYKVTASSLNIRSSASSSSKKLGTLYTGDVVTVTGTSNGWGSVSYQGSTGWIYMKYTEAVSSSGSSSDNYPAGTYKTNQTMNVRSGPDTTYSTIGTVASGTTFTVSKTSGRFGCVNYNGKTGWISLKYSTLVSAASSGSSSGSTAAYTTGTYTVTVDSLYVRSGPDTTYSALGVVKNGYTFTCTDVSGRFGKFTYNGKSAWISLKYCTKVS